MARQKHYVVERTKTLNCPCGYRINSKTDRERILKNELHRRNCDKAVSLNNLKNHIHYHHMETTPLNVAINKRRSNK